MVEGHEASRNPARARAGLRPLHAEPILWCLFKTEVQFAESRVCQLAFIIYGNQGGFAEAPGQRSRVPAPGDCPGTTARSRHCAQPWPRSGTGCRAAGPLPRIAELDGRERDTGRCRPPPRRCRRPAPARSRPIRRRPAPAFLPGQRRGGDLVHQFQGPGGRGELLKTTFFTTCPPLLICLPSSSWITLRCPSRRSRS